MQHDAKCLVVHHISALCEKSSKHLKIAEKTSRLFHIHCTPTQSRLLRVRQYATKPRLIGMEEMKKNPNGRKLCRRHDSLETPPITQCDLHLEKPAATNEAEVWSQVWWLQCLLSATSHQNEEHSSSDSICIIGPLLKASWSEKL